MLTPNESATRLAEDGVVLLRDAFAKDSLAGIRDAASRCFGAIRSAPAIPERYRFNRFSHSVIAEALTDFGCSAEELLSPLSTAGLDHLIAGGLGGAWTCSVENSWVRQKFAPIHVPDAGYRDHSWHQDGALGVTFPPDIGPPPPMTALLTCWIPLTSAGAVSPGLEFVRRRQPALLHFTELDDPSMRRRFAEEEFWAPPLEPGDGLVFLNGTLHRTYTRPDMRHNRLSIEYRLFPR